MRGRLFLCMALPAGRQAVRWGIIHIKLWVNGGAMLKVYSVERASGVPRRNVIAEISRTMRAGGLALLPTETVYGVGVAVCAFNEDASYPCDSQTVNGEPVPAEDTGYGRVFTLKIRQVTQTLPWLVAGPDALDQFGRNIDPRLRTLAEQFWPGALTLVVEAADCVPRYMRAADGTVALRASASPVIQAIIRACNSPLAVTSANSHGLPAPASFDAVEPRILAGVDIAVDAGITPCRDASTIVAVRNGELTILRQGALAADRIFAALD